MGPNQSMPESLGKPRLGNGRIGRRQVPKFLYCQIPEHTYYSTSTVAFHTFPDDADTPSSPPPENIPVCIRYKKFLYVIHYLRLPNLSLDGVLAVIVVWICSVTTPLPLHQRMEFFALVWLATWFGRASLFM